MDTLDRKDCYSGPEPWGKSAEHEDHLWSHDGERYFYCTGLATTLINRPWSRERQQRAVLKRQRDQLELQMKGLSARLVAQVKGELKVKGSFTDHAKRVIELAVLEADENNSQVTVEHLLRGIDRMRHQKEKQEWALAHPEDVRDG